MPTIGSITKTIRIRPQDLEVMKGLMEDGSSWSEAVHKLCEGVPIEQKNVPQIQRMNTYGAPYGLSGEELAEKLLDGMDSGKIIYENGEFRAEEEFELSKFKDACQSKGVPIQKMIDKCTQMIWGM